ncbi:ferredoxin reductase family protein [Acuticoccus kandeliae]|uniref:ferredoxin reductase family protein n=1 Tax=Acuticoccus kandeliae TaxID=2073160 RepID=UPI0014760F22|nr:ferredoxin reductase family protein [Acuticoccus kandeliae]
MRHFSRAAYLISGALILTTILWIAGRIEVGFGPELWPWLAPSQIAMLLSFTCAALALLAVVRAQALEPLFGGLDQGIRIHRRLGLWAFLLMIAHVVLLLLDALSKGISAGVILVPFWSDEARTIDILAFYILIGLGLFAYERRMRHERWLALHRLIGLLFLIGTAHAAMEQSTIRSYEPLRIWIIILLLAGAASWFYRVFLFNTFGPRYRYGVEHATTRGSDVVDLVLRPIDRRMMYQPGTFAFVRTPTLSAHRRELHPFSISSSPVERDLRFSVRQVGDFTRALPSLAKGDEVEIFGPFGGFTPLRFAPYRRMVWIGAGIGITPFLGMLNFEVSNRDFRRIWFYYITRTPEDAVYDEEIRARFLKADSLIDYTQWTTADRGRLSAARIAEDIGLDDYAVMLCGSSAFVDDMAAQFHRLGVPHQRIILEELQFR